MESYLIVNTVFTCSCLMALLLLRKAPARLRFYVCVVALCTWLVPWGLIKLPALASTDVVKTDWVPTFEIPLEFSATASAEPNTAVAGPVTQPTHWSWLTQRWWVLLLTVGILLLARDVVTYIRLHRRWLAESAVDNSLWRTLGFGRAHCDIRRLSGKGPGMTTGFAKPVIWLDNSLTDPATTRMVITHELTHIRQRDPYWMWLITVVHRLFWWNPLVWAYARYARRQIELSCDERCQRQLPEGSYLEKLIEVVLGGAKEKAHSAAVLNIRMKPKFNMQRIQSLTEDRSMKRKYGWTLAILATISMYLGGVALAANSESASSVASAELDEARKLLAQIKREKAALNAREKELLMVLGGLNRTEAHTDITVELAASERMKKQQDVLKVLQEKAHAHQKQRTADLSTLLQQVQEQAQVAQDADLAEKLAAIERIKIIEGQMINEQPVAASDRVLQQLLVEEAKRAREAQVHKEKLIIEELARQRQPAATAVTELERELLEKEVHTQRLQEHARILQEHAQKRQELEQLQKQITEELKRLR